MTLEKRIAAFVKLGEFLNQFGEKNFPIKENVNDSFVEEFTTLIELSQSYNGWFTPEEVKYSVASWAKLLEEDNLRKWLSLYNNVEEIQSKKIALIMAGNIPLVGFHDFLSVLISGHTAIVKTSSNDQILLPFLTKYLIYLEPEFKEKIIFAEGKLKGYDAVIATGSDNTSRYFEYYFSDKPSIIRKNRNSVAILNGKETKEDLALLGEDIFRYFGLGCRNVSKLFVPKDYCFDAFFEAIFQFKDVMNYDKYYNNYDYNKAVFLMSNFKLIDNGFITLKEDQSYNSPISSVFYEHYDNLEDLIIRLEGDSEKIQCVVSNGLMEGSVSFGETQKPKLWEYADNVDTLSFLLAI